ncbi:DUF4349 domain-containing protein [Nocardioides sp.]|uniref:DUF4349 domain-containing protein n=1 Tax=Nocardioides sp. TaxID=35761 RepID=UPI00272476BC|nr:DUF4349 domain-containing protein [Nocardioides sp.]MDO9456856.1 DUF4349 domain-containing protein [Nocardioides sp.]
MTTRARRLVAAAASTALLGLGVAACSAGESDDAGGSSAADDMAAASAPDGAAAAGESLDREVAADAPAEAADELAFETNADSTRSGAGTGAAAPPADNAPEPDPGPRSLIKTGNVALRSTDVKDTLFEVKKVLQQTNGEVAEENTQADDDGEPETALLTVRVPVGQFETALDGLKTLGAEEEGVDLIDSSSTTSDVSTQVIDTDVRVELQKRSIQRISLLLERAASIRDVVNIEQELARREADLGSLQKRQTFLADQTSLSTITISLERPAAKKTATEKREAKEDDSGFFAGLDNGWDAFETVTTGLLTTIGALLPFGVLALVVGLPLRAFLRRREPRTPVPTADAPAPVSA